MRDIPMLYTKDMMVNDYAMQDAQRRAARSQVVRDALAGRRGVVTRIAAPLMLALGQRLVASGAAIQSKYSDAVRERERARTAQTGEYALIRRS